IAMAAVGGFYVVQRSGMFRLLASLAVRLARSSDWHALVEGGEALDRDVRALYGRHGALVASARWTVLSWMVGVCEVWIGLAGARGQGPAAPAARQQRALIHRVAEAPEPAPELVRVDEVRAHPPPDPREPGRRREPGPQLRDHLRVVVRPQERQRHRQPPPLR